MLSFLVVLSRDINLELGPRAKDQESARPQTADRGGAQRVRDSEAGAPPVFYFHFTR